MEPPVTAKAALLQVLTAGPGFGMDLIARVRERTQGRVELGQGSVYPALRDLEREGLVEACKGEQRDVGAGGRPRRHYRITTAGRRVARGHQEIVAGLFGSTA
ncbi:MAG TPA: PadR family transcriptional regulator [Myxococcota bacterium]|nr:PadR family transcriptional regulator [Myxococcota bacterium]